MSLDFLDEIERFVGRIENTKFSADAGSSQDIKQLINEMDLLSKQFVDELKTMTARLGESAIIDICERISIKVNDALLRNEVGENALNSPAFFQKIYETFCIEDNVFQFLLAANSSTPVEILKKLLDSNYQTEEHSPQQIIALTTSDKKILENLSTSKYNCVRWFVASNPHTPAEILTRLASDPDICDYQFNNGEDSEEIFIMWAVLMNPSTPLKVIKDIAKGKIKITYKKFIDIHGFELFDKDQIDEYNEIIQESAEELLLEDE